MLPGDTKIRNMKSTMILSVKYGFFPQMQTKILIAKCGMTVLSARANEWSWSSTMG